MSRGIVVSIFIAPEEKAPVREVETARVVPGRGIEDDRYYHKKGAFSHPSQAGTDVTLIEIEAIEALARDRNIHISPGEARRNVVTRGVALNHLVGKTFSVGGVQFEGLRLCEPCGYLEKLTVEGIKTGLIHRGGLRAKALVEGVIRAGDEVKE